MLDTFAAMVSGDDLPLAHVALKFVRRYGGQKTAAVVGTDVLCGLEAALANGIWAHSDETDDSHSPSHSHLGCAAVPAALVAAELFDVDGQHLLRAVALGYEAGPRVLMALGWSGLPDENASPSHSIANTFGASAAAGCCASPSSQQMRWLLDYAAQQASGVAAWQRGFEHVENAFVFGGMPARTA
jgi:2-methylcitrate dehydratase PrpD